MSQLCVFGNVQIMTQCIHELFAREIPVRWFSYGGWFLLAAHVLGEIPEYVPFMTR